MANNIGLREFVGGWLSLRRKRRKLKDLGIVIFEGVIPGKAEKAEYYDEHESGVRLAYFAFDAKRVSLPDALDLVRSYANLRSKL